LVWIIIAVIMIVAFGPLLWLMPTPRERRLATLRQQAYQQGMRVEMRRLPRQNVPAEDRVSPGGRGRDLSRECAAYVHPLPRRLRMLPAWRLLRGERGLPAVAGWVFEHGRKPQHPRLELALDAVADILQDLPEDVVALECEPQNVAGYWLEGPGTGAARVADLGAVLGRAATVLGELDERLEADTEPGSI